MIFTGSENYLILYQALEKHSASILYQPPEEINTKLLKDKIVKNCKKSTMDFDKHLMCDQAKEKMIIIWKEAYLFI